MRCKGGGVEKERLSGGAVSVCMGGGGGGREKETERGAV